MNFLHPEILFLLPAGLLTGLLYRLGMEKSWSRSRPWKQTPPFRHGVLRPVLWGAATLLVTVALAGPATRDEERLAGAAAQSTVFLVDVSWSMLTSDIPPSRLEATRQALLRLIPDLEGDRAALMIFSGTSVVRSPLTEDRGYLSQAVRSVATGQAARGGTLVGDALRKAADTFGPGEGALTFWLFTDGGDQESFPVEAASDLAARGHRLMVWGLGTQAGGAVPDREAESRLNRSLLQAMAAAVPGGGYWEGDPAGFPGVYRETRQTVPVAGSAPGVNASWSYWLLMAAFLLVCIETFLSFPGGWPGGKVPTLSREDRSNPWE